MRHQRFYAFQTFANFRTLLHSRPRIREIRLFSRNRLQRDNLGNCMLQPLPIPRIRFQPRYGRRKRIGCRSPASKCRGYCIHQHRMPGKCIQQRHMTARIQQPALIILSVNFHQQRANIAQEGGRHRLVVDKRPAAAIGLQGPAKHENALLVLCQIIVCKQGERWMRRIHLENGRSACLHRRLAHQSRIRALAKCQAQPVQQDGLSGAGFARQNMQSGAKLQVHPLDQDEVTDREAD